MEIEEQNRVLENDKKNMLVSASAGSGKTYVMIKYITKLVCEKKIPINEFLILTFTKAAATEMKERLKKNLKEQEITPFILEQIDNLSTANISTIDAFCEKCLKKYANLLQINENFDVLDENSAQKLKKDAFEKAIKKFHDTSYEDYELLMQNLKNDKSKAEEVLFEIEQISNSVYDGEMFYQKLESFEDSFDKALEYLLDCTKNKMTSTLNEIEALHVDEIKMSLEKSLAEFFGAKNLIELSKKIDNFKFPTLPRRKEVGDEVFEKLGRIKKDLLSWFDKITELNLEETFDVQRSGVVEKILLKLFKLYKDEEEKLKQIENVLEFSDLERYAEVLSKQENLFSSIKYVFVDEYQDTNKLQEKLIKQIAKNSNFVAVGDAKQGIYGFRLASSEIFLKDIDEFEKAGDGAVNYLQSNFRSSQKVLDFVNDVFKVCMTKGTTDIDYEATSMLDGKTEFKKEDAKSIYIDLIKEKEKVVETLPKVYSVKNAKLEKNENFLLQVEDIAARIREVLNSEIFEKGQYRKCCYSDIAILSRSRDALFNNLSIFLQSCGIPLVANSRENLLDEVEIKVLLNFLKIAQNMDDEIALASVLVSPFGRINLQQLLREKQNFDGDLCQLVKEDKNGLFEKFNKNLEKFRENIEIFGIKNAFLRLFDETNYFSYLNLKPDHSRIKMFVEKFLSEIVDGGNDFDLASAIERFESVEIAVSAEPSLMENAVLLTTIHNSKGLEYPIVFLIGCDQSLSKAQKGNVEINEKFGMAVKFFDLEKNSEVVSVRMRAIRESERQKAFVEELKIFYVALTRAKNRVYLFGQYDESIFKCYNVENCDSYFDLIFFAMPKLKQNILEHSEYEDENLECEVVDEILEETPEKIDWKDEVVPNAEDIEKINVFFDFEYPFSKSANFRAKESVTSLNSRHEDVLEKFSNENFSFGGASVDVGNAYHLALKILDFEKISTMEDLGREIEKNKDVFEDILKFLNLDTLLKNILLLKKFVIGGKVFKEKEFIMKDKISNMLDDFDVDDEVLVQGVVDFFVVFEDRVVLIDFKYSNTKDEQALILRYKNQLKLYKNAIKNSFKISKIDTYLLSLKNNNLIKVDL